MQCWLDRQYWEIWARFAGSRCKHSRPLIEMQQRGLDEPRAIAPIVANQQVLGHVSVVLPALPAPPLTLLALEQGSYVLALELARDRKIHEVELRVRREFAEDLLAGRYDDAEQMRARGRHLGYHMRGPFQVLIFALDSPEGFARIKWHAVTVGLSKRLMLTDDLQGRALSRCRIFWVKTFMAASSSGSWPALRLARLNTSPVRMSGVNPTTS